MFDLKLSGTQSSLSSLGAFKAVSTLQGPVSILSKPDAAESNNPRIWVIFMWSLSFLKPYVRVLVGFMLTTCIVSVAELMLPKFLQYFIDTVIPSRNSGDFVGLVVLILLLVVIMLAVSRAQNLLQRYYQEYAARDFQLHLFQNVLHFGFPYYDQHPVGETVALLNTEVNQVQGFYRLFLPWMMQSFSFFVISLCFMMSTSWRLTLVTIPFFLLYYIFGPTIERKCGPANYELAHSRVQANKVLYESLSALAEIRAYSAHSWNMTRAKSMLQDWNRKSIRSSLLNNLRITNRTTSVYLGTICTIFLGIEFVHNKQLASGGFVAFILYYSAALYQITRFVTNITETKVAMYGAQKLYRLAKTLPSVSDIAGINKPTPVVKGEVCLEDVHFQYSHGRPVLAGINLKIHPGQRIAVVGESGNGKSTLLKLIGRFYDPVQGIITLDGVPINEIPLDILRNIMGCVFQETFLFGISVRENIRFGNPQASDEEVIRAARGALAHDFILDLPNGYNTVLGERGSNLSGGQRQRIALARVLVKNPTVILLDEATSSLDNRSERELQLALEDLMPGRTVIAVAHRLTTIRDFDQIIVLKDGKVAECGTHNDLMAARGVYYQLLDDQSKETIR